MMPTSPYKALMAHTRQTEALGQVAGLLSWDQETVMPARGGPQRAEHSAAVEAARHARLCDPQIADWLAAIDVQKLTLPQARNVALITRSHARATRIPARLATEIAHLASHGQGVWAAARAARSFADFAPTLTMMLALKREEAACLKTPGGSLYDALVDEFEPGTTAASLTALFDELRPRLVELRARIAATTPRQKRLSGPFPKAAQLALAHELATTFSYNFDAGRLDLAVHPFSSGTMGDARITTRVEENDPFNCIYSTIHEVGHAIYEQNIDPAKMLTPIGRDAGMGVHESQSRMLENQIGRSRAFMEHLYPLMRDKFGRFGAANPDELYAAVNAVSPGYIRTEADEVHYNLHIMMRFGLERAMIAGELEVADLEGEWNARFERDFGIAVPHAANGILQDVHWSVGLFGYFPTYTLGNIYAAMLFAKMRHDIPAIDDKIAAGEIAPLTTWLTENIHRHGNATPPRDRIEAVAGQKITTNPLGDYLAGKFGALYSL